jgi:hypothetical protein
VIVLAAAIQASGANMVEMSFLLSVAITFDPTLTLQTATALVTLVGKGAFAYYWLRKIIKDA